MDKLKISFNGTGYLSATNLNDYNIGDVYDVFKTILKKHNLKLDGLTCELKRGTDDRFNY